MKADRQIAQELLSIRDGKYSDDVIGGWLDPVLSRKACEEEMQYVKKHAAYEKVPMSQSWKETGKNCVKTCWADKKKGTSGSCRRQHQAPSRGQCSW